MNDVHPEVRMPVCPGCGQPPEFLLGGGTQAFCGSEACRVVTWDPTSDPERFWVEAKEISFTMKGEPS